MYTGGRRGYAAAREEARRAREKINKGGALCVCIAVCFQKMGVWGCVVEVVEGGEKVSGDDLIDRRASREPPRFDGKLGHENAASRSRVPEWRPPRLRVTGVGDPSSAALRAGVTQ